MSEDAGEQSWLPARTTIIYLVVCFLVGAAGIAAAAHLANSSPAEGTTPIGTANGLTVYVEGNKQIDLEDPQGSLGSTVNLVTESGNATVYSPGQANATIHVDDIEGTWTNVTELDADPNIVEIDPADKDQATVGKDINWFQWRSNIAADDGTIDFSYDGGPGASEVTVQGVAASTRLAAVDQSSGAILDEADSGSGGTVTFDQLDVGTHDAVIQAFQPNAPTFTNPQPTGGVSTAPTRISIDVNDGDFPQGDSVTVTIDLDGSQIHSETITSNGTITTSVPSSGQTGGSHSWSVEAVDDYGETSTDSYSYSVPSELTFREEEPGHDLIENTSDPITVEATFFEDVEDDPVIINRTTTDATIDLDGLPVSSEFSVSVEAPGYHNRTVRLDDIFQQSTVFLINKDRNTVENRFVVSDATGQFPASETEIGIQAPINQSLYASGGTDWLAVTGDDLGADEAFVADLIDEKRYRIVVENEDGDRRILGAYTAETTGTIALNIGNIDLAPTAAGGVMANATWSNSSGTPVVQVGYNDTTGNTTTLHVNIYERNNASNILLDNQSYSGPFGEFSQTEVVPAGENDTTWVVELVAERDNGENVEIRKLVGPGAPVLTDMPSWLVTIVFVGMIWGVAGLFSQLNGHVGGLVVAGLGAMFYFVGLVPGYLGGGVVALSLLTAGILFIREGRGGGL